jgi:uncharacterized membrane protein (DUF2068 family)
MTKATETSPEPAPTAPATPPGLLPGIAIIALWMLLLCGIGLVGVITHNYPPVVTVFCALFAASAQGLLKLRRWGWALALAAAFLSTTYGVWILIRFHQSPAIILVMVNLVFFLYLVRPAVIERMR